MVFLTLPKFGYFSGKFDSKICESIEKLFQTQNKTKVTFTIFSESLESEQNAAKSKYEPKFDAGKFT